MGGVRVVSGCVGRLGEELVTVLDSHGEEADALSVYHGAVDDDIDELVERIGQMLESRDQSLLGYRLGLRQQAELVLVLARHHAPGPGRRDVRDFSAHCLQGRQAHGSPADSCAGHD